LLKSEFPGKKIYHGQEGLLSLLDNNITDTVVNAISGTVSLEATVMAIQRGYRICLANKETLVAAGELINDILRDSKAEVIPIDSEQSAIFQSIGNNSNEDIKRVILTASGGPFFNKSEADFSSFTVVEALAHPTWSMGTKITIDSATMMNKALEIIETFYLFKLAKDQIDVIVHPQSIVHSMVEFVDSSIIAQLSLPDMKLPILYSLTYPHRLSFNTSSLDLSQLKKLEFFKVDHEKFKSIKMAYFVLERGKNAGAVFNAANEVAVDFFLNEKISFKAIFDVVGEILYNEKFFHMSSISDVNETINETKNKTKKIINRRIAK